MAAGSEVSDDAASWETVNDDEMDTLENAQEVCICSEHQYVCHSTLFTVCQKGLAKKLVSVILMLGWDLLFKRTSRSGFTKKGFGKIVPWPLLSFDNATW